MHPRIIRYHPKILKSCFFMYVTSNLMTIMDTTKATIIPTISTIISIEVKTNPNFINLNKLAPNITGIAKKNVNSVDTSLEMPSSNAPNINYLF